MLKKKITPTGVRILLPAIFLIAFLMTSCGGSGNKKTSQNAGKKNVAAPAVKVPDFNADSAYAYVARQIAFGPRVPETKAHARCAAWLENTLKRFTKNVTVQNFKARVYNNEILEGQNIIASFNPGMSNRIFLSAHWDSRPFADHDPDVSKHHTPIAGANDGASGTGILLEVARQLSMQAPKYGVDIILFDLEDYGPPQDDQTDQSTESWGLGSQYWANNPHRIGYTAKYGVLLDMVGAPDARFPLEGFSMYYAPDITKKIWNLADRLGYGDYFVMNQGDYITDDHYFINELTGIPTIDIVHLEPGSSNGTFYEYWHTTGDNLDQIDRSTLKVVGQVVLTIAYRQNLE